MVVVLVVLAGTMDLVPAVAWDKELFNCGLEAALGKPVFSERLCIEKSSKCLD
jgi:hypothetical protein